MSRSILTFFPLALLAFTVIPAAPAMADWSYRCVHKWCKLVPPAKAGAEWGLDSTVKNLGPDIIHNFTLPKEDGDKARSICKINQVTRLLAFQSLPFPTGVYYQTLGFNTRTQSGGQVAKPKPACNNASCDEETEIDWQDIGDDDSTVPIATPITAPISSPITAPISSGTINGPTDIGSGTAIATAGFHF